MKARLLVLLRMSFVREHLLETVPWLARQMVIAKMESVNVILDTKRPIVLRYEEEKGREERKKEGKWGKNEQGRKKERRERREGRREGGGRMGRREG